MTNYMKKTILLLLLLFLTETLFSSTTTIANMYDTDLDYMDMIQIFFERDLRWAWQIVDYEVFTDKEDQNYAWAVQENKDSGYMSSDGEYIPGRYIKLCMSNGYIIWRGYGSNTSVSGRETYNVNVSDYKVRKMLYKSVYNYILDGRRWKKRYHSDFKDHEKYSLKKLLDHVANLAGEKVSDEDLKELGLEDAWMYMWSKD